MSVKTVRDAIDRGATHPQSRPGVINRDEARAIVRAAEADARGGVQVGKGEAELVARLVPEPATGTPLSAFEDRKRALPEATPAGAEVLNAFFVRHHLPLGKNQGTVKALIDYILLDRDLDEPLATPPSTRGLYPLLIDDRRPVDGALREAFVDPARNEFYLRATASGRGGPHAPRWFGPIALQATAPGADPEGEPRATANVVLRAALAEVTRDLRFASESDYPFDTFFRDNPGSERVTPARFRALAGLGAAEPVQERPFAELMDRLTTAIDPADPASEAYAGRLRALRTVLESNLTDLQVFRTGTIQVGVYFVGRNPYGDLVGLHTTSIET